MYKHKAKGLDMFTIKKAMNKNGYIISTGDGRPVYVKDTEEITQCVNHWFGDVGCDANFCPFCKKIAKRNNN